MKKQLFFVAILVFFFSTMSFAKYTIEVCKISVGQAFLAFGIPVPIHHVFLKSNVWGTLNFGPVEKELGKMMANDLLPANVTDEPHEMAKCRAVHEVEDTESGMMRHSELWSLFQKHYANTAETTLYNLFNDHGGKNCGKVAAEALAGVRALAEGVELKEFPFRNINGQDYTEKLMRGTRGLAAGDISPENVHNALNGFGGALAGIAAEVQVGQRGARGASNAEVGRAVRNIGQAFDQILGFRW